MSAPQSSPETPLPPWLEQALARAGLAARGWTPLAGGRVNRCWRSGEVVAKLFAADGKTPLFRNDPDAEWLALEHFAPLGLAPEPLARGRTAGRSWIAMRAVDGPPAEDHAAIAVLRRIHDARPGAPWPTLTPDVLESQCYAMLRDLPVSEADRLRQARPDMAFPDGPAATLHGDPVTSNILSDRAAPVAIDWQCPCYGDPCVDLSVFLSPAMRSLYGGSVPRPGDVGDWMAAYGVLETAARYRRFAPVLHWRLAIYCAWMGARGWTGYAEAGALERAPITVT
ncbi:phosphotransferase family protein [Anianabacter salinae]|uniref:phosphotransferase family protein n=1 Tax=Anianabacter salinae TaxID=2851023 RepID=UPI00225E0077|nr:aminoglycoside phosphotransferase family protein [Anianabacter salinae]MBV0913437.1 aminoglycoside phosphotransferase family protein [Anianabacter salinae]